jgi:hypothetical protein
LTEGRKARGEKGRNEGVLTKGWKEGTKEGTDHHLWASFPPIMRGRGKAGGRATRVFRPAWQDLLPAALGRRDKEGKKATIMAG